ncbi:MAG: aspartate/glutamate racemase family protein [Myxococcota bacterium]
MKEVVGVVDWGIGGLDLFTRLRAPRMVYLSDSGTAPYGRLCAASLLRRFEVLERALLERGVTRIVVACNTLSTILPLARPRVPTSGVIRPTLAFLNDSNFSNLAVVGTDRTVASGAYLEAPAVVAQRSIQPLGALIERGEGTCSRRVRTVVAEALDGLACNGLVLGCTHYAAVRAEFERHVATIIDPVDVVLDQLSYATKTPVRDVWTTGCPATMRRAAHAAFGVRLGPIHVLSDRPEIRP